MWCSDHGHWNWISKMPEHGETPNRVNKPTSLATRFRTPWLPAFGNGRQKQRYCGPSSLLSCWQFATFQYCWGQIVHAPVWHLGIICISWVGEKQGQNTVNNGWKYRKCGKTYGHLCPPDLAKIHHLKLIGRIILCVFFFSDTPDMLHKFISSWLSCFVACHLHDHGGYRGLKVQLDWFKWLCDTMTLPKPYKLENGDGRDSVKRRNTLLNQKNAVFLLQASRSFELRRGCHVMPSCHLQPFDKLNLFRSTPQWLQAATSLRLTSRLRLGIQPYLVQFEM